jgi:hypothetical protein
MPGRRVSHVFVVEVPSHPNLLGVTDAAINITPDPNAKAEILQNAIELFRLIGVERPKVAILSAVETINPAIVSTLDAACLTLMARREQLHGAIVDAPLAFDNASSAAAAKEKGIVSDVAGDADILLVPDLVSRNILAKDLDGAGGGRRRGGWLGRSRRPHLAGRSSWGRVWHPWHWARSCFMAGRSFRRSLHRRRPVRMSRRSRTMPAARWRSETDVEGRRRAGPGLRGSPVAKWPVELDLQFHAAMALMRTNARADGGEPARASSRRIRSSRFEND